MITIIKSTVFVITIIIYPHHKRPLMAVLIESPAPSYNILWAILGALVAAISVVLYYVSQKKDLNYL